MVQPGHMCQSSKSEGSQEDTFRGLVGMASLQKLMRKITNLYFTEKNPKTKTSFKAAFELHVRNSH